MLGTNLISWLDSLKRLGEGRVTCNIAGQNSYLDRG